jgi:hypothetical protein
LNKKRIFLRSHLSVLRIKVVVVVFLLLNLCLSLSQFIDSQKIEIQENPEGLRGGAQPERISIYLEDDLVSTDCLNPGDKVSINGVLNIKSVNIGVRSFFQHQTSVSNCNNYSIIDTTYESIEISPEDIEEIKAASKKPDIFLDLSKSIAPSIFGMDTIKRFDLYKNEIKEKMIELFRIMGEENIPHIEKSFDLMQKIKRVLPN